MVLQFILKKYIYLKKKKHFNTIQCNTVNEIQNYELKHNSIHFNRITYKLKLKLQRVILNHIKVTTVHKNGITWHKKLEQLEVGHTF